MTKVYSFFFRYLSPTEIEWLDKIIRWTLAGCIALATGLVWGSLISLQLSKM